MPAKAKTATATNGAKPAALSGARSRVSKANQKMGKMVTKNDKSHPGTSGWSKEASARRAMEDA
jgi:hypothetical protein